MAEAFAQSAHGDETSDGSAPKWIAQFMTWALILLLVWLPLQTPIAIAVFQYGHSESLARAVLLLKDASVALLVLFSLAVTWRSLKLRWFDKVAIAYVVVVGIYSTVPWLLGSHQTITVVASSARQFAMPVEAYALGRLAFLAGADVKFIFKAFVAASAVVALMGVAEYFFLPITFWSSTLDLVTFERVVQSIPGAKNLWDIALLGEYGAGTGVYPRSIATFTHPVGAGLYFLLPMGLTVAAWFGGEARGKRLMTAGLVALTLLFGLATIVTISRGAWVAAAAIVIMCGYAFRRFRLAILCLAIAGIFVAGVPPFNTSITSALDRNDASVLGHIEAIGRDVETGITNVFGLGLGSADRVVMKNAAPPKPKSSPGSVTQTTTGSNDAESVGLGEDLYLSVFISTGPLGALTFVAWCLGLIVALLRGARRSPNRSLLIGASAALIGALLSALTCSALMRFTTAASVWLLLGLATGLVLAVSPEAGDPLRLGFPRPRRRGRPLPPDQSESGPA